MSQGTKGARDAGRPSTRGMVSVIIPTFNRAALVVDAIRSAKAQTYPSIQIIVIDDGSTDDTARRVAEEGGVEYHFQENRRQGAARNLGLGHARGEFIASLDSDDLWDEDFLERSVRALEEFNLDLAFSNWRKVREGLSHPSEWLRDGKWKRYQRQPRDDWYLLTPAEVRRLFLEICPAPSSSLVLRRDSIVSGWGERMKIADDWYLLLEIALGRPCRAAFSMTPRWSKRVDGLNVYDGRPFSEAARELHLHDHLIFRRDFQSRLTLFERLTLSRRAAYYRLRLLFHESAGTELGTRLKVPLLIRRLRGPVEAQGGGYGKVDRRPAVDE